MLVIILISLLTALLFYTFIKPYNYWKQRGVTRIAQPWPLFGSLAPVIFKRQSMAELLQKLYNEHSTERYVCLYQFLSPTIILREPDLIKRIAVKDFDNFPEHTMFAPEESDPLWAKTLFAMPGGKQWRDLRSVLSPAFTSSKLKTMFGLITDCAQQFAHNLSDHTEHSLDIKDAFTKVTNDIIASTAFGVSCDSSKMPDNEIFTMGKNASDLSGLLPSLKFFVAAISPALAKFLKVRFISKSTTEFFRNIIKETISFREKNGVVRPDMIHLMMEARKGKLKTEGEDVYDHSRRGLLTDDVVTAQALVFFLAGFDTVSTAMSYAAYELALNPPIQRRLQKEIDETLENSNGAITYEDLMAMKYLDMVISETLRKWPPFAVTDRKSIKSYVIEPKTSSENPLMLDANIVLQIPIFSLHRDPGWYPDPETFDPERFSDERKHNIKPFTYLPFGTGPRSCIGSRFALIEVKTVIFYILKCFDIITVERTQIPLVLSKSNVNPVPDDGFWLGIKARTNVVT